MRPKAEKKSLSVGRNAANPFSSLKVSRECNKLFETTDMQVVIMCREHSDFVLPSLQLDRRRRSFVGSPVTIDLIKLVFT